MELSLPKVTCAVPAFIGIDGGGTHSAGVAVDRQGNVLATARAGSLNFFSSGVPVARKNLKLLIATLRKRSDKRYSIERTTIGCSALFTDATPAEKRLLCQRILPLEQTRVVSDSQTAYFGATLGAPGVLVIAGTGSMVLARNERGSFASVGGWGHLLGDEGSAWWIAVESIKAAIAAEEGRGPKTMLSAVIRRYFRVRRLNDLVPRIYRSDFSKNQLAALAGHLAATSVARDRVFRSVCRRAGRELATQVLAAARNAGLKSQPLPVFLLGSVVTRNSIVRNNLIRHLKGRLKVRIERPQLDAVHGAAAMALSEARTPLAPTVVTKLKRSFRSN
jgi:N-acetylglucosamine kinase-like BadF-type ATPase